MKRVSTQRVCAICTLWLAIACNDEVEFQGVQAEPADPPLVVTETFAPGERRVEEVKYDFESHTIKRELQLADVTTQTVSFQQAERPRFAQTWQQGNDGQSAVERFDISEAGRLDLAIIVDDSSSMSEEHTNLSEKLEALLSELQGVDWRMGIATTTSSCLRPAGRVIASTDPDYTSQYIEAVSPGTGGSGNERGLEAGADLIRGTCEGQSWLRDDSTLAVLFVSDENSYCGWNCTGNEKPETFVETMRSLRPGRDDLLRAYALTWNEDDCEGTRESEGKRYEQVVDAIGGLTLPICGDYSDLLSRISADVAGAVKKQVQLAQVPIKGSLSVTIDGQAFYDFQLAGKVLKLGSQSSNAGLLEAHYSHDPAPKRQQFLLSDHPNLASLVVKVNSEVVSSDHFRINGRNLDFLQMPENNATIEVAYRVGSDLSKQFSLEEVPAIGEPLDVAVNGNTVEYQIENNILTFAEAPSDGAEIAVRYTEDDPVYSYDVDVPQLYSVEEVLAYDVVTGEEAVVDFFEGVVTIDQEEFRPGRELELQFRYYLDARVADFEFPPHAEQETLSVSADGAECTHEFSDQGALFVSCDSSVEILAVGYEVYEPAEVLMLEADYPENAVIHVWQEDEEILFERTGRQLHLLDVSKEGIDLSVQIQIPN